MLELIESLPHSVVKNINGLDNLTVYAVEDFNQKLLKNMVEFGLDVFGEEMGMDEWSLVPQIRHGNVYVLAERGQQKVIGLAIFMRDWEYVNTAYLFDYAVSEDYQGRGLGFQFLKIICEDLEGQGFEKISLTVDADNKPAMRLYKEKLGFEPIDFVKDEYGKGHDRYVMELNIEDFLEEDSTNWISAISYIWYNQSEGRLIWDRLK